GRWGRGAADDRGLLARIEEIDGVGVWVRAQVVDAAQIVVRMAVGPMPGTGSADVGPAAGDPEAAMANPEVVEHALGRVVHAVHEVMERLQFVQSLFRLPAFASLEIGERRTDRRECPEDRVIDRRVYVGPEGRLPDKAR